MTTTSDIGRIAVEVLRPPEWPLSNTGVQKRRAGIHPGPTGKQRILRVEAAVRDASDDRFDVRFQFARLSWPAARGAPFAGRFHALRPIAL